VSTLPAIVICTMNARCLAVMKASIAAYVPREVEVLIFRNVGSSFGEAYNHGVREAFRAHESVVVCNDDIVFTPTTWETLAYDVAHLRANIADLGWVATRSDYARGGQNIRIGRGQINFLRYESEQHILRADIIAPICAWIHRDAWIDFPPINWFSDDVQCLEMKRQHFVSRAYVHHVGSQTCGQDAKKCMEDAEPWLRANRPELHARWYLTNRA
jgi:hypothetical protein